jgi:uncharacterized glyoxalase superfamily protein PhnB
MIENRSIPRCTVIPQLPYADVKEATAWLCHVFGFSLRIDIGSHRAQLNVGDGAVVLTELGKGVGAQEVRTPGQNLSVMVRVPDVYQHHERVRQCGARVVRPPADYPYGERQYSVADLAGYIWTFSQSIADVRPEDWGGVSGQL